MLHIVAFPLRSPSPGSDALTPIHPKAVAPSIIWRSGAPARRKRFAAPAPLHLVTGADRDRLIHQRTHRTRARARFLEGAYVAAALGIACAIFWSAR